MDQKQQKAGRSSDFDLASWKHYACQRVAALCAALTHASHETGRYLSAQGMMEIQFGATPDGRGTRRPTSSKITTRCSTSPAISSVSRPERRSTCAGGLRTVPPRVSVGAEASWPTYLPALSLQILAQLRKTTRPPHSGRGSTPAHESLREWPKATRPGRRVDQPAPAAAQTSSQNL